LHIDNENAANMIYPIGIQNFESMRNDGYVYVDKTALVYELATTGRYYFLSRPRRFGKSLLISTLEAYFSGKKDLFQGLAIEKLEQKWTKHPILHLDLNTRQYENLDSLKSELNKHLEIWEKLYGDQYKDRALEERFFHVISNAYEKTGERVVILVDEYDKPMLQAIGNDKLQEEYRNTLKAFYSVVKTQDEFIKFGFFTGVTKLTSGRSCSRSTENASTLSSHLNATFGKVNVFSDLNNLTDISMDYRYIDICGITDEELHSYFDEPIGELALRNKMNKEECYAKLKLQYDGYHFDEESEGLYNPFSILNTLAKKKFGNYWFETGTPSFLVYLLKNANYDLNHITEEQVTSDLLGSIDSVSMNPIPIIYQSGYLTIKGYDEEFSLYKLGFPNREVENGFIKYLMPYYTPAKEEQSAFFIADFVKDIRQGNPDGFMERMQAMFADNDYQIAGKMELYFQNAMYVIFKLMGFYVEVERTTSRGRIDVVLKTKDYIYVMELKLDGSADEALKQIDDKGYAEPFAKDGRALYKIGVNFSSETRGIKEWKSISL
jgi:hypothetical protein